MEPPSRRRGSSGRCRHIPQGDSRRAVQKHLASDEQRCISKQRSCFMLLPATNGDEEATAFSADLWPRTTLCRLLCGLPTSPNVLRIFKNCSNDGQSLLAGQRPCSENAIRFLVPRPKTPVWGRIFKSQASSLRYSRTASWKLTPLISCSRWKLIRP